ncbi:glycosyltransferase family 2 protein [Microvirga puerhi]|uniref:Glycosyltransferase family 2 protein n=1 Tax=Microvirga puerhi TaxID=2876078 RepID=A0ABS7VL67_9HYPH|nr:glycosyltransferase family 2 protein [Microvirga puerhi]MBZ6075880.1 glycosyltransferase family 2 protein [Microvirga puerhi]
MEKVSIIIVNYRTADLTIECVKSILAADIKNILIEIIILDNASQDGSYERLASLFPTLAVVALEKNVGFAAGNNRGVEIATGEYVLFLNPDTVVKPGAIEALYAFAKRRPEAGAWGGRTLFADGSLNPTSVSAFVTMRSILYRAVGLSALLKKSPTFNPETYPGWQRDTERKVDILFFCFVLVRADIWRKLGGFDERFFMFCEDDDICWRMQRVGLDRLFSPEACIIHYGGASTPSRPNRIAMLLAARLMWLKLHWSPLAARTAWLIIQAGVFARMVANKTVGWGAHQTAVWEQVWAERAVWARFPN